MKPSKNELTLATIKMIREGADVWEYPENQPKDLLSLLVEASGDKSTENKYLCLEVVCDLVIDKILTVGQVRTEQPWYRRHSDWQANLAKFEQALPQ